MLFWIIVIAVALLCGAVLARAALAGRGGEMPPAACDLRVYRDQLGEVESDRARGIIGAAEAERVRTEISRRILAADARLRAGGEGRAQPRAAGWALAGLALAGLTGGTALLYAGLGAPGYRDLPITARLAASDAARAERLNQAEAETRVVAAAPELPPGASAEYLDLVEKLRQAVAGRPDDPRGLGLLVRNETALGNFAAAYAAQQQLIAVRGAEATAFDYGLLADLMVSAAQGYVSTEAEAVIRDALARDPREPRARYYLGLYLIQVDRPDAAFRTWEQLLSESRPEAPWVPMIRAQIEELAWRAGVDYELAPQERAPGPDAADMAAAAEMSADERAGMIRGMVERLESRLQDEGGEAADWARLITALGVLEETERARAAWQEAQAVFAGQDAALAALTEAARRAGLVE